MIHDYQFGVLLDCILDTIRLYKPLAVEWHVRCLHTTIPNKVIDRADHRIVLNIGADHMVAG